MTKTQWQEHARLVTMDYTCPLCPYETDDAAEIIRHLVEEATKQAPHPCRHCGFVGRGHVHSK